MIYEKNLPAGTPNPSYKIRAISDTGASENVAYDELLGAMVHEYLTHADLPNPGNVNNHYKVTQDPTAANNGYYHWDGTVYVKDSDYQTTLNKANSEAKAAKIVKKHNPDLTFKGFVNTTTATPSAHFLDAYISTESGTVFGLTVVKGDIIECVDGVNWSVNRDFEYVVKVPKGFSVGRNKLPEDYVYLDHMMIDDTTGLPVYNTVYATSITKFFEIKPNTVYVSNLATGIAVAEYDKNFNFIKYNFVTNSSPFTTDSATKYVRAHFSQVLTGTLQLEEGSTPSYYNPYEIIPNTDKVIKTSDIAKDQLIKTEPLLNLVSPKVTYYTSSMVNSIGVIESTADTRGVFDFMTLPISSGGKSISTNNAFTVEIHQYDINGNYLGKVSIHANNPGVLDNNAYKIRIMIYSATRPTNLMVVLGDWFPNYEDYQEVIADSYLDGTYERKDPLIAKKQPAYNLINPNWSYGENLQIRGDTGEVKSGTAKVTPFIDFRFAAGKNISAGAIGGGTQLAQYKENGEFIRYDSVYNNTVPIDINCAKVRIQFYLTLAEYCYVLGDVKPEYVYDYKEVIGETNLPDRTVQGISVPSTMYAYKTKEFNVYHKSLVSHPDKDFHVILDGLNNTRQISRNASITADISGTAKLYDDNFRLKDSKPFTVKVGDNTLDTGSINFLAFGDSYTSPGIWVDKVRTLCPNLNPVGIIDSTNSVTPTLQEEGRAGWTLKQYLEVIHSETGVNGFSPFMQPSGVYNYYGCTQNILDNINHNGLWQYMDTKIAEIGFDNTTGLLSTPNVNDCMYHYANSQYEYWDGSAWTAINEVTLDFQFNFAKYRSVWNIPQVDFVAIMLGVNDFGARNPFEVQGIWDDYFKSYMDTVIASILADNPSCKVGVIIPNNKFGDLPTFAYDSFGEMKDAAMFEARKLIISEYDNRTGEGIYVVNACDSLDPVYGHGELSEELPFEESTVTQTRLVTSDIVHPNTGGYHSIGVPVAGWVQSLR